VVHGRTILSPALGTIIGFSFWAIVVALTIIVYQYSHA
jgi:tryptophan-rich sensory protein